MLFHPKVRPSQIFTALLFAPLAYGGGLFTPAHAGDLEIKQSYDQAYHLFEQRSPTQALPVEKALQALSQIEGKAEDKNLNYDIYILESRCLYWKGTHQKSDDDKLITHDLGIKKAEKARALDDGYAEAYYYAGINLARWAEAKGILSSLSRKAELENNMHLTLTHRTRTDEPGQVIDGYGPDRVFGRMFFKLPSLLGGSLEKSLFHLARAFSETKNFALNVVFYAETLSHGSSDQKTLARKLLDELLAQDPQAYNPSRLPETLEEFELARTLRKALN